MRIRRYMLASIVAGMVLNAAPVVAQSQTKYEFNLAAQPLADSLRAVGSRAGVNVAFDAATVRGKTAPALRGTYSASEALEQLTTGSGLVMHTTQGGSFVVESSDPSAPTSASDKASVLNTADIDQTANANDQSSELTEIVVTGTSIRGLVAPVGASTTSIDDAQVRATGAANMVDLLSTLPQMSTFGSTPRGNASATQSFSIPSLRNLTTQQGDGTLFLFNGIRMVGGGFSTRPDPAVIPPAALQRLDVVMGGGSAVYGSDAVAGTVDYILRRKMRGAELSAMYGGADHYSTYDVNGALGTQWDSGNVMLSFDYASHSNIAGRDRDYYTNDNTARGGSDFRLAFCNKPNITIGSTTYAYPGMAPGTRNVCDPTDNTDLYPEEVRRSALISFDQEIVASLQFSLDAYYSERTDDFSISQTTARGTIRSTNPYFVAPPSAPSATSENLQFNFADVFGNQLHTNQEFKTWQYVPSLKWSMGGGWQATATVNVGYGDGVVHAGSINANAYTAALAGTTTATALNPYDLTQTNPSILAQIRNFNQYDKRVHKMDQERIAVDGPVMELPGGTMRVAVGSERYFESQWSVSDAGPYGHEVEFGGVPRAYGSRVVKSAFAEVVVPVVGPDNALPGLRSLTFDISARYDEYSDFGDTSNPRYAVNWKPLDDLVIRADYSTAFVAPSLNSTTKPQVAMITATTTLIPPGGTANRPQVILQGGNPDLKPETADIYDIGFDWDPAFLSGLSVSATYYHIDFTNLIGGPNTAVFFSTPGYARFYIVNPSAAQLSDFVGSLPRSPSVPLDFYGAPQIVIDSRTSNLGTVIATGFDYSVRYAIETNFGTFTPAISGTHGIRLDTSTPAGSPFLSNFDNGYPNDSFNASLTYKSGPAIARVSWDYVEGFPVRGVVNQTRVGSFDTLDLYAGYELPDVGFTRGTTVSVNLDNVFDNEPSYQNVAGGIGSGSIFGRFLSLTIKKKFLD